jgi:cyanophycin synthetase
MKILDTKVLRGPNYWSDDIEKLIVIKLDIEDLEDYPTNDISGFADRLEELMPSLHEHYCSRGKEGGFFERVREGTWIGHVVEHIALELQWLAGLKCGYGKTRSAEQKGVYYVVFEYETEESGLYAGEAAIKIAEHLVKNEPITIEEEIAEIGRIRDETCDGPTTTSLLKEAERRNIPYTFVNNGSYILFGQGIHQKRIKASLACSTSCLGVDIASNKEETKKLLSGYGIPVPKGRLISEIDELEEAITLLGFPLAIKPVDGNHGRGITTKIQTKESAVEAFNLAKKVSDELIVEQSIEGFDYRFLVINFKLVAVAKRIPAMVTGDGVSSIGMLVQQVNSNPERGEDHGKSLTKIKVDESTITILTSKNLTVDSVLPKGESFILKNTANLSTGGTAKDVTDKVHPDNVWYAERIARLLNLNICGIDIIATSISSSIKDNNGKVLEVNASPGFRMHLHPTSGLPQNVAEPVMKMLFPEGKECRIPVIAVTGTNGKTTTTRLIAHMAKTAGHSVGFITTDGVYVNDKTIERGDCTGPVSARKILTDPSVDFAVLECARGGILRSGLGFDYCNISIITNISEDHIGHDSVETISDLTNVKAVLAKRTLPSGYCILNADDDNVYEMRNGLKCNIALFSIHENNERIIAHCAKGGMAATIDKDYLTIHKGEWKMRLHKIGAIPLSFAGKAECMIYNILPSVLAAVIQGMDLQVIEKALMSFIPSPEFTPGRFNIFQFRNFDVMVDYAHNAVSIRELKKFLPSKNEHHLVGIITAVGDRRDEEIRGVGYSAAMVFDEIIIRHDRDMRGRTKENMTQILLEGIRAMNPTIPVQVISSEKDALLYAMKKAQPGTFITMCTENVQDAISFVKEEKAREEINDQFVEQAIAV